MLLHHNTHHDATMNCQRITVIMHLDQTSYNTEGGTRPKRNKIINEWCMKKIKNEQSKKKLIGITLKILKNIRCKRNMYDVGRKSPK